MKQTFDWLRKRINDTNGVDLFGDKFTNINRVNRIINEAEAKWESDCCEWKYRSPASYAEAHKRWELISDVRDWWRFCPYCGKRIKISEVE